MWAYARQTESMNYDFRYGMLNLKQMNSKFRQNNLGFLSLVDGF